MDPRVGEARTACIAGDFQKGVRLLADLYTATDDPIWVFNQGRCYQQNAQPALALSRFKEFLRKSKGGEDDEDVQDARKYIAELEAEGQSTSGVVANEPKSAGAAGTLSPAPVEQVLQSERSPSESLTSVPETVQSRPPVYRRWWFLTGAAAVVVAGTVTAILLSRGSSNGVSCASPICVER